MENNIVLSLVIPVYNEEKNLPTTLPKLAKWLADGRGSREVVLYDDGSRDGSAELIRSCAEHHPGMRLISSEQNRGKGASVRAGMLAARGKYRVFTDCDLAYGLDAVRRIEEKLKNSGAGAVIGSRALHPSGYQGYSVFRRVMSRAYVDLLKIAAGLNHTDSQCGIKGFTASSAERIFSLCQTDRFAFDLEVLTVAKKLRIRVRELPVNIIRHDQNQSKVRIVHDTVRMLKDVYRIRALHKELTPDTENACRADLNSVRLNADIGS
ncbi:MAG: glycosyltransferase [Clostridia bacterium]|nr:glycosyltransferase [Clostridia bacterium]